VTTGVRVAVAVNPAATEMLVSARNSRREIRLDILSSPLGMALSVPPNDHAEARRLLASATATGSMAVRL